MKFFQRFFKSEPESLGQERVVFDDDSITRTMAGGQQESIRWSALQEVSIVTTDEGPFADDVFWVLSGSEGGCAVPSSALGAGDLLVRLQRLPGFDNEEVVRAMGSTSNAKFLCWRREGAGAHVGEAFGKGEGADESQGT
jgi:hypothetical protein